jgi:RHS repeat-associated protein
LELGVAYGATTTWKLYGPDLNGRYGGLNGTGGYDADSPGLNLFNPTLSDFRGNILGYYNSAGGSNVWNAARPTGYGAVPGYRPVALANSANVPQASAWRGHWPDITGYYHIGLRDLYPVSGGWLSSDSIWNERDPNWYTFAGGDPVNHGDWDGRLGKDNLPQNLYFGTAPVMATSIQPTLYLYDGTVIPPNPNGNLVDPGQVASYTYNLVTQPTGQSFSFISPVPLPDGYGQSTSVPITHADQEMQQGDQFLKFVATAALSEVGSEFLLGGGALAAEGTAQTATQLEFNFANDFGQNSGLVIGRGADLSAPGALGTGEYKLGWFSVQSTSGMDAEWSVNQAKLQNVMNLNLPIRDASSLLDTGGFYLNNERSMLQSAGWNYQGGYWVPPTH